MTYCDDLCVKGVNFGTRNLSSDAVRKASAELNSSSISELFTFSDSHKKSIYFQ